jgi:hypothetical protein
MTGADERNQEQSGASASGPPSRLDFLLPVWGHRHIGSFLEFGLPSLLAAGNLPALSRLLPCSFVVLTRREDAATFLEHPAGRRLSEFCHVDVQPIDDLIIEGHHSVTLTLAYERAIRARDSAARDTCFFFLVADFLVADGTLARVYERIRSGSSAVVGGNFQITAEDATADLRPLVDADQKLTLSPRQLMALALRHLHPVTLAKFMNIPLCHDPLANRLFWRANERTLLGRFFLFHMIAIRPEVTSFSISAPCDYSFVPELCPSGNVAVMTDSDEYLIVEMQPRRHELSRIRPGPFDVAALGRSLSDWTTAEHRANVRHTVTFHVEDSPAAAGAVAAAADDFVVEMERRFVGPPKPHRDQKYWVRAIAERPDKSSPAAGYTQQSGRSGLVEWPSWRVALFGRIPDLRPWHPLWPDFRRLRSALQDHFPKGERLLIVGASARFASWLGEAGWTIETRELASCLPGQSPPASNARSFAGVLLLVNTESTDRYASAMLEIEKRVRPGGAMIVMATNGFDCDSPQPVSADWLAGAGSLAASGIQIEKCVAVYRRSLDSVLQDTFVNLLRAGYHHPARQAFSGFISILLLPISWISNLLTVRRQSPPASGFWSSIIIVMRSGMNTTPEHAPPTMGNDLGNAAGDREVGVSLQPSVLSAESIGDFR